MGGEEVELMTFEGIPVLHVAIAAGIGMDAVDRDVVVVEQHTHAGVVALEGTADEFLVGGMVTVVGLAVEHVFLEIPVAHLVEGAGFGCQVVAVEDDVSVVIVLHDKALEHERKVEVARYDGLAIGYDFGNAAVKGIQAYSAALTAYSVGDLYLLVFGNPGEGRYGDGLEGFGVLNTDIGLELSVEGS